MNMSFLNQNPCEKEKSKPLERINLRPYLKKEVKSRWTQLGLKQISNVFMLKMESKDLLTKVQVPLNQLNMILDQFNQLQKLNLG